MGRAGAGEGSALRGLLRELGRLRLGAGVGLGAAAPPRPTRRRPPGARFAGCVPDARTLRVPCPAPGPLCPGSSVPLQSLPRSVRPCPSASVCSFVFICYLSRPVRLSDCLCPSVASPAVIVYSSESVRLSACPVCPCLCTFSLAQANSWHSSKAPSPSPLGPRAGWGVGRKPLSAFLKYRLSLLGLPPRAQLRAGRPKN